MDQASVRWPLMGAGAFITLPRKLLPLEEQFPEVEEGRFWERFGKDIGDLVRGLDAFHLNLFCSHAVPEVVKLCGNVLCSGSQFVLSCQF